MTTDRNSNYSINLDSVTEDKLFLLSIIQVNKYFSSDESRKCAPTAYDKSNGSCWWWLRSHGFLPTYAACVRSDGNVDTSGSHVDYGSGGVRPALWIDLSDL